ncbi:MAG: proline--tRNA ligase [Candidatus Omnitrophica bacterium]|nr:proline--tRNA ligase [Candidatus Omnitrophota bacterium]
MKWSEFLLPTLKEVPAEAEAASHILMLRAGLIRKLTAGVYSYLPCGLRVLRKIERIVREEMDRQGALEVLLPAIQPLDLWMKSGRFAALGEDMITFIDRHKKQNVLGPTHEEVITALVKQEIGSYRQMPVILYQIQTKFRDEARPRFGVMRSREFIMKDAYSFDVSWECLDRSYAKMYDAYCRIFQRCGLRFLAVEADTGVMGGDASHEFMVVAPNGEDRIVSCAACGYAASLEKAACLRREQAPAAQAAPVERPWEILPTPGKRAVEEVAAFLGITAADLIKTIMYSADGKPAAVIVRGDHEVNEAKLRRCLGARQLTLADEKMIVQATGAPVGFSGPVGLSAAVPIIADYALAAGGPWVTGANQADAHLRNVSLPRDVAITQWADVRYITPADCCPRCGKEIRLEQAIEVGHVFKLGTKYTESLQANFLDDAGRSAPMIMGCYGIGVTRIIAACLEQNHDAQGIIWPAEIAPFQALIMPLNPEDPASRATADSCYRQLQRQGIEILLDDRNVRAGVKFKDADLSGIPVQVIIGEKNLAQGNVEIKTRCSGERLLAPVSAAAARVQELLGME